MNNKNNVTKILIWPSITWERTGREVEAEGKLSSESEVEAEVEGKLKTCFHITGY